MTGYFAYIVQCANGTLYTGWTVNLDKRLQAHNSKKGARYTRAHGPVTLRAYWTFESKQAAMSREWEIKKMTRAAKQKLIEEFTCKP